MTKSEAKRALDRLLIFRKWQLRKVRKCLESGHRIYKGEIEYGYCSEVNNPFTAEVLSSSFAGNEFYYNLKWSCDQCHSPLTTRPHPVYKIPTAIFNHFSRQYILDVIRIYEIGFPFQYKKSESTV